MDERDAETMELVSGSPFASMGRTLKALRESKKLTQLQVAERGKISNNRVSEIEKGHNVQLDTLHCYALGLGYRNILEMFRAPTDDTLRKLLKLWPALDEQERSDVLAEVQDLLAGKRE